LTKIVHISDLHFGRVNLEVLEALLADIYAERPELIAVSGDLTQRATDKEFRAARAFLDRLPPPFIVVPGNHDVPGIWRAFERATRPLGRYKTHIAADLDQTYFDDRLAVVGLNSARAWNWRWNGFWKDGAISDRQLARARDQFAGAPSGAARVVIVHHPPAPPEPRHAHDCTVNAAALVRMLEESKVDLILSGHLHLSHVEDLRSQYPALARQIWTIQASTATSTRLRGRPNAYNVIAIDGPSIAITIKEWTGTRFEAKQSMRFARGV